MVCIHVEKYSLFVEKQTCGVRIWTLFGSTV